MSIEIRNISKTFGQFKALDNVNLHVATGELVALLGPSGSGKTTLLRIIAGLETADQGEIRFHGEDTTQRNVRERGVGFVFQHYALFPHMTVFENIAFGLRVRPRGTRPSKAEILDKVMDLLKLVQLEGLARRFPTQLSGGQRQRVALARALAVEPKVLLLDEPFGALDAQVRQELRRWLRRLHDELHVTSVFVTYDQEEALEVSDRIVVMNKGQIEQVGTPEEVYDHPANPFVYNFLGNVNLFHGRMHEGKAQLASSEPKPAGSLVSDVAPLVGYVRPHELEITRTRNGVPTVEAIIRHIHPVGAVVRLELERDGSGDPIVAELTRDQYKELEPQVGEKVHVKPRNLTIFTEDYSI